MRSQAWRQSAVVERVIAIGRRTDLVHFAGLQGVLKQPAVTLSSNPGIGIEGGADGMRRDQFVRFTLRVAAVARPAVGARVIHHAGPHRVELDVAHATQEIEVVLHEARAIPPLPQGATARVGAIDVLYVALTERRHQVARRPRH